MMAATHYGRFVLTEQGLLYVELALLCRCSYCTKSPPKPDRHENQIPYFEVERGFPLNMLRFVALYQ